MMVVGVCQVELHLPGNRSLKEKRGLLKPLLNRLRRQFNLAVAEVELNDAWQSAMIGMTAISNDADHTRNILEQAVRWIESQCPEVQVVDWEVELY